ncbi:MAG: hypothetical protein AAGE59_33225 [Cyanobacteria bacterium P01_F01_bin.86]
MQNLEALHQEAMDLVDQAVLARQRSDTEAALAFARTAFAKERAAADLVVDQWDLEPTRSVLHRSAAALAVECHALRDAERLIGRALAGNPPNDIADELRDLLLEDIYSQRQAIGQ